VDGEWQTAKQRKRKERVKEKEKGGEVREGKTYRRGNMIVENECGRVRVSIAFIGNLKIHSV
jgi:hypothetical protein